MHQNDKKRRIFAKFTILIYLTTLGSPFSVFASPTINQPSPSINQGVPPADAIPTANPFGFAQPALTPPTNDPNLGPVVPSTGDQSTSLFGGTSPLGLPVDLSLDGLSQDLGQLNQTLGEISGAMDAANINWAQTNTNWEVTNQHLGETNLQLEQFNTQWETTNQLLTQLMSPSHMVLLGLSAGAGFALGSMAIHLVASAAAKTASALYEAVYHKKRDQQLLENFQEAMTQYETLSTSVKRIDRAIDAHLDLLEAIDSSGGANQMLAALSQDIEIKQQVVKALRSYLSRLISKLITSGTEHAHITHLIRDQQKALTLFLAQLGLQIRAATQLRTQLETLQSTRQQADLCSTLQKQLRNLFEAEPELQRARIALTDDQVRAAWEKHWTHRLSTQVQMTQRAWKSKNRDSIVRNLKQAATKHLRLYLQANPDWKKQTLKYYKDCLKNQSAIASNPLLGPVFARKLRRECWTQAVSLPYLSQNESSRQQSTRANSTALSQARGISELDIELESSQNERISSGELQPPRINPVANAMSRKVTHDFFRTLRLEQTEAKTQARMDELFKFKYRFDIVCVL